MNLQETIIQLNELKLRGRYVILLRGHDQPSCTEPPIPGSRHLQDGGCRGAGQTDRKTAMYLKISKLRYTALLEDVICGTDRNFTKDDLAAIADCAFIRRHENLLIQRKVRLRKILPCLCPWKTGLHARLQNSLSQYEQLCGESCTQQAGWVVPEDDNQSGKV